MTLRDVDARTWLLGAGFLALIAAYAVLSQAWVTSLSLIHI